MELTQSSTPQDSEFEAFKFDLTQFNESRN